MEARDWEKVAARLLRAEMKRQGVSYRKLSSLLEMLGVKVTSRVLINRVNRGKFPLAFYLQCLAAMRAEDGFPASIQAELRKIRSEQE